MTENRYSQQQNFVRPEPSRAIVRSMSEAESLALQGIARSNVNETIQRVSMPDTEGSHTGHVRHNSNPISEAKASLLYSLAYTVGGFFVILALLVLSGITDGDIASFIGILIFGTGLVGVIALICNRWQGLHHSATGIAHGELRVRERTVSTNAQVEIARINAAADVAKHAIDTSSQTMITLRRLESGKDEQS